jgi:PPP family 3-phenylpropionic acid transporter
MAGHTALCFVQGPIGPLNDGLVLGEARRRREAGLPPVRLERIRAWGSASALAFMLGCGPVARALPQDALIWIMTVIAGCALVASFFLLRGFEATRGPEPTRRMEDAAPLRRPALLAGIIAAAALVGGSHGFLTVFGSLHWAAQGLDANFIAVAWGVSWVSEVAFFFAANRWFAGERHAGSLMAVGAAGGVLRWVLLATDPGPAGVLCAQILQPLSGAAFSLGPAYLIAELGGRAYTARVHGWLAAATGLSLSASLYASGPLEAAFGQRGYLAMAAMAALGFSIALGIIAATRGGVRPEPKTAAETTAAEMETDAVP